MPNVYLDVIYVFNLRLSASHLGMLPLEATVLYIEQSVVNKHGGLKDMILSNRFRS